MKPFILIFFFLIFIIPQSKSQEYNYYHYDIKDGLSGITVYTIAQDKDGFLWFGTETGLSRFDGSHFKNYTANEGLSDNEIINLFVDSKNRVWIFPFKNAVYYYYQGKIHNNSNDSLIKKFHLKNEIYKACEDSMGNIFFIEQKKIHILSATNNLIEINEIHGHSVYCEGCGISKNGTCNLYIRSLKDATTVYEYKNSNFISKSVLQGYNFSRNRLEANANYTITRNRFFFEIYNQKTNQQFQVKMSQDFHTVSYINDSCFALITFDKTFLYNIMQKKIVDSFLINKVVNKCFKDNENNLWFATMTQGIYRLSSTKVKVYRIEDNLNPLPVFALNGFNNHLHIGSTENVFWNLDLQSNKLKKINLNTELILRKIYEIQNVSAQKLFFASNVGLFEINKNQASLHLTDITIKSLNINNDAMVVATDRAAFEVSLLNFKRYDTIWNSRATCAYKKNNHYYIGTLNGLYIVNNDPKRSTIDLGNSFPVLKDKIITIKATSNGDLWIATETHGLICLRDDKLIYQLTVKNGLTSNTCRCIYTTEKNVWLGTNRGISKIDISHYPFQITNYTAAEGLDCEIINCMYVKGDSVFAGTPFGISFFKDNKIEQKSLCRLKLLDIKSKKGDWYYRQDSMHLSSNDDFLHFEYTGISFVSAGDITYYYQLKGLNDTWQPTKQNSVEFQSLPAGSYQFNIYAINKYGTKSQVLSVSFTKAKTFWQLIWVRILLFVFVALSVWLIMRERIRRVRAKSNANLMRERKIYELEQMALRAQMNPHFIFNSLNSIQQYVFAGNAVEANQFITNFSSLMRQTLYISGKKFVALDEEIKYLDTYLNLEQAKYENIFDFQINQAMEIIEEDIIIPPLLLQPYIENSIRHGVLNMKEYRGKILIDFIVENNFLKCIIEDNGIGRENAIRLKKNSTANHQSKGMELVQKRIESLNSIYNILITVFIEDLFENDKTGTRVTIKLPLNYE